jgi:hypothetical protein
MQRMASIDAAEGANWQRQAKRLRNDIRGMISSHRREYSVGLAVEFAMVQDTRVTGNVGLGEPLFDCVHHLARSQLKTYGTKLPPTDLWGGKIESCVGRTRVFCTNLPPYSQLKLESSEREARLLQIFRDVNRLFQEGKILLEAMPSQLADLVALNLRECEWRAQGQVVEESRWVGFTDGCEWLLTLFAASWGPANKFGLVGQRSTIREASQEITRKVANRYMEVPYQGSRVWESSGCFFDIRRNLFGDSIRLIDWLLSLLTSDENTTAEIKGTIRAKSPTGDNTQLAEAKFVFYPDGDGYFLRGFGQEGHVSATRAKGLHDLYGLIQHPDKPVLMLVLDAAPGDKSDELSNRSRQPVADDQTFKQMASARKRLQARIAEAEYDAEREKLEAELFELERTAVSMYGINGNSRDLNDPTSRLRPKILKRLRTAYTYLRNANLDELAKHFEIAVSSVSNSIVYRPANDEMIWKVEKL